MAIQSLCGYSICMLLYNLYVAIHSLYGYKSLCGYQFRIWGYIDQRNSHLVYHFSSVRARPSVSVCAFTYKLQFYSVYITSVITIVASLLCSNLIQQTADIRSSALIIIGSICDKLCGTDANLIARRPEIDV